MDLWDLTQVQGHAVWGSLPVTAA